MALAASLVATSALAVGRAELTPSARQSIDKGLAYLAQTQRSNGSWPSSYGKTTGIVGSCALAFMSAGHTPNRGKYSRNVSKALNFLLEKSQPSGLVYESGMSGHPMYHHGLATLALAEAWGESWDSRMRDKLKRAIELIIRTQNAKGGWRYFPRVYDADISVTVMMLLALRAAKDAGMNVPKSVIDSGIEYIKNCSNPDGGFNYTGSGTSNFSRTGAGVLSLQVCGDYKAREVQKGIDYILKQKGKKISQWYYYGVYYSSQGVYQWGGQAWEEWYPFIRQDLINRQNSNRQKDGSWPRQYDQYSSAMAILVLAIPYRYLPIYQR